MDSGGRILAIDYGSERVGLALSDPLRILARPHLTLRNDIHMWDRLKEVVTSEAVVSIIVGMPLNLKGEKGTKAQEVDRFVERLRGEVSVAIEVWDERFTTTMAHQTLRAMGTSKSSRRTDKGRVDAMAAAILLQSYLDSAKKSPGCGPW